MSSSTTPPPPRRGAGSRRPPFGRHPCGRRPDPGRRLHRHRRPHLPEPGARHRLRSRSPPPPMTSRSAPASRSPRPGPSARSIRAPSTSRPATAYSVFAIGSLAATLPAASAPPTDTIGATDQAPGLVQPVHPLHPDRRRGLRRRPQPRDEPRSPLGSNPLLLAATHLPWVAALLRTAVPVLPGAAVSFQCAVRRAARDDRARSGPARHPEESPFDPRDP